MRAWMCVGLFVWGAACAQGASKQSAAVPVLRGPVVLRASNALHKELAAFPRVVATGDVPPAVADKVNTSLAKLDASAVAAALDCRKSFREQQHKADDTAWTRTVEVTMQGPRFLSLVATDDYFCGGMYPNDGILFPLVYDMTTGSPVNWLKYLPKGATSVLSNSGDGAKMGVVVWPVLTAMGKKQADADCKDSFDDSSEPVQFALWLDARRGTILAQPVSFPHAIAGCADALPIGVSEARRMGFAPELVDALDAAHRMQR